MTRRQLIARHLTRSQYSVGWVLLLAVVLHLGPTISGQFYADDYFQRAALLGSNALSEKGLLAGVPVHNFWYFIAHQFSFFAPQFENFHAMLDVGVLPWWSNDAAFMNFFRPLSAFTHYFEYRLYPNNAHLMQFVSLLLYLLGLVAVYKCYLVLGFSKALSLLALLLLALDLTVFSGLAWIAARNLLLVFFLGFITLYAFHRGVESKPWYVFSLVALIATLLSAEAGIAICAYLGAYTLAYDQREWKARCLALLPFVLITVIWRLVYQTAGYGVSGIDLYVDPGQSPFYFLTRAGWAYPANYFELLSGIDIFAGQIRYDVRQMLAFAGVMSFLLMAYALKDELKHSRLCRFAFLAVLLSLVASLTVTISSRALFIPFAAQALLFAYVLKKLVSAKTLPCIQRFVVRLLAVYIIVVHMLLSAVLSCVSLYSSLTHSSAEAIDADVNEIVHSIDGLNMADIANKQVMIINSPKPYLLAYLPYEMDSKQYQLASSIRALATAYTEVTVQRVSESEVLLVNNKGLRFDASPLALDLPWAHAAFMSYELLGLNRSQDTVWQLGKQRVFEDVTISLEKLYQNRPTAIRIELTQPLASYSWYDWDVSEKQYREFKLPAVGDEIILPSIFEVTSKLKDIKE